MANNSNLKERQRPWEHALAQKVATILNRETGERMTLAVD